MDDLQYVKMCYEAKELQRLWKPHPSDFFTSRKNGLSKTEQVPVQGILPQDTPAFWLPTQEQLQKISIKTPLDNMKIIAFTAPDTEGTEKYRKYGGYRYVEQFTSWSQLWLAFTMYYEFNQIWNGETWVEAPR